MLTLSKPLQHKAGPIAKNIKKFGGAKRDRTADLYNAIVALSQLSYSPPISPGTLQRSLLSPAVPEAAEMRQALCLSQPMARGQAKNAFGRNRS